jgi:hypothetical protein
MTVTIVETRAPARAIAAVWTPTPAPMSRPRLAPVGGLLGVQEFPATPAGYAQLLGWLGGFGAVCLVGVEGTGSHGAGMRYDRARGSLDRHATYIVEAYLAGAAR